MIKTKLPYWAFTVCKILLSVLLLSTGEKTAAQGGGNHWVFGTGGYGLDFSKDPPEFYKTSIVSLHAFAALSSDKGELLFYTGLDSIWDRNHNLMKGAEKLESRTGAGRYDLEQIVPVPGQVGKYYIFTGGVPHFEYSFPKFKKRLDYVTIDMNKNGGNGQVIDSVPNFLTSESAFNILSIPHSNQTDYWLLARSRDTMLVFAINAQGIQLKRKIFLEEPLKKAPAFISANSNRFKVSNNGRNLIWVQLYGDTSLLPNGSYNNFIICSSVKHMSFNPETGEVGAPRIIDSIQSFKVSNFIPTKSFRFIDAAFSPNDSVLYTLSDLISGSQNGLYTTIVKQYIFNGVDSFSLVFADTLNGPAFANSIRLAPNGKMMLSGYFSNNPLFRAPSKISIIDQPDVIGKGCKIIQNAISLPYLLHRYGSSGEVDTTYTSFYDFAVNTGNRLRVKYLYRPNERCDGFTRFYNFSDSVRFENFTWYINGDSLAGYEVNYAFKQPGKYYVRLKGTTPKGLSVWFTDTVVIEGHHFKPKAGFSSQTQAGCRWVGFQFQDTSVSIYSRNGWRKWLFGDGNSYTYSDTVLFNQIEHTYTTEGNFNVKLLVNNGHCTDTFAALQQVKILDAPKPGFAISPAKGCSPLQVSLVNQSQGAVDSLWYSIDNGTTWQHTLGVFTQMITSGGAYKFMQQLKGPTGCFTYDTQAVVITQGLPVGYLPQLTSSTFTPQNQVEVNWEDNSVASLYTLEHSSNGSNFNTVVTKQSTFFLHTTPSALTENYYRLVAHDSCGNLSTPSALIKPVFLKVSAINNTQAAVTFSAYEHSNKKVWSYSIERRRDDQYKYEQVINWSPQILFADSGFFNESGYQSCYRIKVDLDSAAASYSNEVCLPYAPILWIPDAFSPNDDGLNDDFYVVHAGVKFFSIAIYNSWGGKVYESSNPSFRWLGNNMPEGIYTYVISATTLQQRVNTSGTITLLR